MRFIRLICLLMTLCILIGVAGCTKDNPVSQTSSTQSKAESRVNGDDSNSGVESQVSKITDVDFSEIPAIATPSVRAYSGKDTVLLEYINPGMDSYESTLVNFSLRESKKLGQIDLGNGIFNVKAYENGSFSVFSAFDLKGTYYSSDCQVTKTVDINCIDGDAGFIVQSYDGGKILASDMRSGEMYLISSDGNEKTAIDIEPGFYEPVNCVDGKFVVTQNGQSVFVIEQDGTVRSLFSKGGVTKVNDDYAMGRIGDYLVFLPLNHGDWMFKDVEDIEETPIAAGKGLFLTSSVQGDSSVLRLYSLAKSRFAVKKIEGDIATAAITSDGQIVVVCRSGEGFTYKFFDTADWEEKSFVTDNSLTKFAETVELAELGNADEADEFAREVLDKYNVRFVNEHCSFIDELAEVGIYATIATDRERILYAEKLLVKNFAFLPDKVWQNVGNELPFVVFLCDIIPGNAEGLSFEYGGYNCIMVEINGNDEYCSDIFIHELGHAINHCTLRKHPELFEEWMKLTPQDVLDAVENGTLDGVNALTVEFTPYDKSGEVCYVSSYALSNPEEDRAETIAKFYDEVYMGQPVEMFSHDVLKQKALFWGKMIRMTFELDDDVELPFDVLK